MKLYESMNLYLANQEISYIKLHNLHWYIKGSSFFVLHEKFEELYNQTAGIIDEVAERLLMLGQNPVANVKKALEIATIKELDDAAISKDDAIHQLTEDIKYWIKDTAEIISLAEEAGDNVTADMFIGYQKEYQKLLWMLHSYSAS